MPPSSVVSSQGSAAPDSVPGTLLEKVTIRLFDPSDTELLAYLAFLHGNCIMTDHAIVSFLLPINKDKLLNFWRNVVTEVRSGERFLVLLFDESAPATELSRPGERLMGAVMLKTPQSETGPFRGWVEKLLVHPKFRRRGAARALMAKLEEEAIRRGRTLLMADTERGKPSEELYRNLGWTEVGCIPNYSNSPGGGQKDAVFFYKHLV